MLDLISIVLMFAACALGVIYIHGCEALKRNASMILNAALLLISLGLLVYLVYALLRPEKF